MWLYCYPHLIQGDYAINHVIVLLCLSAANECQVDEARLYIERNVMSHIYTHAMYPNGDGDIMRDK